MRGWWAAATRYCCCCMHAVMRGWRVAAILLLLHACMQRAGEAHAGNVNTCRPSCCLQLSSAHQTLSHSEVGVKSAPPSSSSPPSKVTLYKNFRPCLPFQTLSAGRAETTASHFGPPAHCLPVPLDPRSLKSRRRFRAIVRVAFIGPDHTKESFGALFCSVPEMRRTSGKALKAREYTVI